MRVDFRPTLAIQRALYDLPRSPARFQAYLRALDFDPLTQYPRLPPLVAFNPMGRDHVAAHLDALLAADAEPLVAHALVDAAAEYPNLDDRLDAALVVIDDRGGGWTNRAAVEFALDFTGLTPHAPAWITVPSWTADPPHAHAATLAARMVVHRVAYIRAHGPARTLRDRLAQEGAVLARAGADGPTLDPDDLAYTRAVLEPHLDADDMRTAVECLFGDAAARSLGFTPRGLSPNAGLALARHDALSPGTRGRQPQADTRPPASPSPP
jgi:hypothetical protein